MNTEEVIIIGAGPSGLAIAAYLHQSGIPYLMLEKNESIASMWHQHYDRLHLHTVKQWSHLPFVPFPKTYPTYVPRESLVQYYEDYARKLEIYPQFGQEVTKVSRQSGGWLINTQDQSFHRKHVIIATGVNRVPVYPTWSGESEFEGKISHSRSYKNVVPYRGRKVLVVGMGNTGAEIALDLAENDVETYLSVRSEVNIVPRDIMGRPTQVTAKLLDRLPFGLGKWLGAISTRLVLGNLSKYGLKQSKLHPVDQLRLTGKTPVLDLGTVAQIKAGKIKVVGDIVSIHRTGVSVEGGQQIDIDHIILATGYKPQLEELLSYTGQLLDKNGVPKSPIGSGDFEGLYFIGFDNYKLGGILGIIQSEAKEIHDHLDNLINNGT